MQTLSDADLAIGILNRDARAFEALFERYAEALSRHAACILHDEDAAHDVAQETFLRVWQRIEQWDGRGVFRAWLYRIATNLALNALRTIQRRRELPLEPPPDPEDDDGDADLVPSWMVDRASLGPESAVELAEQRATYRQALAQLPDDKREAFRLVYEQEMSIRDAADALDVPEGTVKSRLHYARRQLARDWRELEAGS